MTTDARCHNTPDPQQREAARAVALVVHRLTAKRRSRVAAEPDTVTSFAALADEIEAGGRWPKTLRVESVLCWPRRSYPLMRQTLMAEAGVTDHTTVAGMTDRQRRALVVVLRDPPGRSGR